MLHLTSLGLRGSAQRMASGRRGPARDQYRSRRLAGEGCNRPDGQAIPVLSAAAASTFVRAAAWNALEMREPWVGVKARQWIDVGMDGLTRRRRLFVSGS